LRLNELFKQAQYQPIALEDQVTLIYAGTEGLLDTVPVDRAQDWKRDFLRAYATQYSDLRRDVRASGGANLTDDVKGRIASTIKSFNATWS